MTTRLRFTRAALIAFVASIALLASAAWSLTTPRATYIHYEGKMERGRVPFALDLLIEGSSIEGSFYRQDRGEWAIVQGTTRRDGGLTLIGRNGEGQEISRFTLRRTAHGEFAGSWRGTPDGEGHPRTVDVTLREQLSAAAALNGIALKEKLFAFRNRRGTEDPAAEFVSVGPELRALSYGSSGDALERLRREIFQFQVGSADAPVETGIAALQRSRLRRFLAEYGEARAELLADTSAENTAYRDLTLQWSRIERAFVRLNECYLLVLENTSYTFLGGAHGTYASDYGIFDLHTGRRLRSADLFVPGAENQLRTMLKAKVLAVVAERTGEPVAEHDFLYEGEFPVTENIYLRRDGVGFHYNVYEIAAYVMGDFDIVLTWDELSGILKPNTPASRLLPGAPQGDTR